MIEDDGAVLAESGAVMDYILATYGRGCLRPAAGDPEFADYLYWFHFANGTLQPSMGRNMILGRLDLARDHPVLLAMQERQRRAFILVEGPQGAGPKLPGKIFNPAAQKMVL